ncbi:MAG: helix-turn-helix transcriptional regulator [Bacteroidaceae bacterium]|nr:helix-turn-helix transcriptional regulator [Bacteroidaceae bacterium]
MSVINECNECSKQDVLLTAAYDMHERMWGLSISATGRTSSALPYTSSNNKQPKKSPTEFCIACVAFGSGYLDCDAIKHKPLETGDIIMLLPGESYSLTPGEQGWSLYWVEFGGYAVDNMVRNGFFSERSKIFQVNELHHIVDIFREIQKTMSGSGAGKQQYAGSLVHLILGKLYYASKSDSLDDVYILRIIGRAKSIMKDEAQMHLPIDEIARQLDISYSLFRREFRRLCGIPPGQYRQEAKLEKAKELLLTTNISIADIASHLSFENLGQFSTFFRKRVGVPPLEYRKRKIYAQVQTSQNAEL